MHLKSIEINGFKSFAQKTVLDFQGRIGNRYSITSVVGPNGSGKSNVSDAILWVMGEQRMSQIRAKKSEDVIFSGTDAKGQMGMASVTLVLDNKDHRAPIEYDELVITRRLYRTGDSEYLINGKKVRLLDLQILLAQAQFGHGSYSVVGQGTIDQMLLQSHAERKDFFDEASGIKEFQIKRHQASLKLGRTRENVEQGEMVLNEISPRLKSLSRQVKKLEKRQEVELSLRELQEQYYATLFNFNQVKIDGLQGELDKIEEDYTKLNSNLTTLQEELAGLAREESRQEAFDVLQREYRVVVEKKNNLEREKAVLSGKMQAEYSKVGKQNVGWLEGKIDELKKEHDNSTKDFDSAVLGLEKLENNLKLENKKLEENSIKRTELRGQISNLNQQLTQTKSEQSFFQMTGMKAVQAILEERHKFGHVYGAVAQLGKVDSRYQLAMDVAAGSHISSIVVRDEQSAGQCIEYLRQERLGIATFLPITKIRPRVVSRDVTAITEYKGVLGLATELVQYDEKFEGIFSYIFGNTIIVENIDIARQIGIGKVRMVTLEGDVFERSGSMKGGYRSRERRNGLSFSQGSSPHILQGNSLDLEEKSEALQKELDAMEVMYEKQQGIVRLLSTELQVANGRRELLEVKKQGRDKELASLEQELSLHTMSPDEYDSVMKELNIQKEELDNQLLIVEGEAEKIQTKLEKFNQDEELKKQRIFTLQQTMQDAQAKLNSSVEEKNQNRMELVKFETKQEDLMQEVYQEMHTTIESVLGRGQTDLDASQLEQAQVDIQKLKYTLSLIGGIDEEVVSEYEETRARHDDLVNNLDDLGKAMIDLEKLIIELDDVMKKTRDIAFKKIRKEFSRYFKVLFDGGKADLIEVYDEEMIDDKMISDNKEEDISSIIYHSSSGGEEIEETQKKKKKGKKILTGIDVIANPPGKKIKHLQTLSGGERTLTSLALLCAILSINPSPFVVLDEVEAALDEANSIRFTKILDELAIQSQFIVVSHNRATMHASDALYGVTMGNDGISRLVSVKLGESK
ncbi:AAA family ATPase [Patescibacteria group bacterium]|nr:AAA family ATPase [Patescibacteria group bacterium]MBU1895979.1 AAA family ATPase [Patescibacteria group bacterium]